MPKSLFSREKKENAYTPKSLQGVRGRPLRAVLVYRSLLASQKRVLRSVVLRRGFAERGL